MTTGRTRVLGWTLVGVQGLLLLALIALPWRVSPANAMSTAPWLWIGTVIAIVGLLLAVVAMRQLGAALTATPVPNDNAPLVVSGVYGRVRHPIYSGILLASAGFSIAVGSWWQLGVWVVLLVFFWFKARWEDRLLAERHPDHWGAYAARTGTLIPWSG